MELVLDIVIDAAKDTLALVPFLFVTFALLAVFEFAAGDKIRSAIQRAGAAGPVVGAIAGIVPQCGFSAMGATLYAGRVITLGTLVAVFLSTSDEMLPLLVAEQVDLGKMTFILLTKAVVAVVSGMAIDLALRGIRKSPRLHATLKRRVLGPGMSDEASVASAVEEEEEEDDPAWNAVSGRAGIPAASSRCRATTPRPATSTAAVAAARRSTPRTSGRLPGSRSVPPSRTR